MQNTIKNPPFRSMDLLMALLSVCSVLLVGLRWLAADYFSPQTLSLFYDIDSLICYIFLIHFVYGFVTAQDKNNFILTNWFYLPGSLPMVEELRWARLIQLWRAVAFLRQHPNILGLLRRQQGESQLAGLLLFFFTLLGGGATLIYFAELGDPNSQIKTAYDAFWWTLVTLSTIGYGDIVPQTHEGRFVAIVLIMVGVGLFSALSGFMASLFLKPFEKKQEHYLHKQLNLLAKQQAELLIQLQELKNQQHEDETTPKDKP